VAEALEYAVIIWRALQRIIDSEGYDPEIASAIENALSKRKDFIAFDGKIIRIDMGRHAAVVENAYKERILPFTGGRR
jgi:hypothetical protein